MPSSDSLPVRGNRRDYALRDWLDRLDLTERLTVLKPGADLHFELAGIANRLDGRQASYFPKPGGNDVGVVSGLISNRAWMAEALGVAEDMLVPAFQDAIANPLPTVTIENASCQEVVHDDPDLEKLLPIPTHNEHDSGAYITAGLAITKNPKTGVQNVAIHRLQVSGPKELGVLLLPRHTLAFFESVEKDGGDLDIAIVVGARPATLLASQAVMPIDFDELEIAGALGGASLEVTRCLESDIVVPADAEIVIEGKIVAHRRAMEGPFGEFPQYYGEQAERHVIQVTKVTHRKDPIFHTIVGGGLEHLLLGAIPRETTILTTLQRNFLCVRNAYLTMGGVCRYHLVIQVENPKPGEAKNILMAAFGAHYDIKQAIVVDADVDIHDSDKVEWAVATRFQADTDLITVHNAQGSKLDPSSREGISSKLGYDATVPAAAPEFKFTTIRVPGEEDIDLDAKIDDASLKDVRGR